MNYNILIVDDVPDNIRVAMNILKDDSYDFSFAKNGQIALELLDEQNCDLVLLDIMMPGMDGYEVCEKIKSNPRIADIPVIFLTARTDVDALSRGFSVGAIDFITKPFHSDELLARVKTHLELFRAKELLKNNNLSLQKEVKIEQERVLEEIFQSEINTVRILTELIETVSDETGKHIKRVAEYSKLLAHHHKNISQEDEDIIYYVSPLHDIGKMAVPEHILNKNGSLTEEEFEVMKEHTSKAHRYLKIANSEILKAADIVAYEHHEKWNGTGYPRGLKGEDIHIFGRIVALADVFDALTAKRVYKKSWTPAEAAEYIIEHGNIQFDPYLVEIFEENLDAFIEISKR